MTKARDLANFVSTGNPLADGTIDPADINGVTATAAELNILDGATVTAAELNVLEGVTATAAELNYNDITTLGTSEASKVVTADANGDVLLSQELTAISYNETCAEVTSTANAATINCETGNVFSYTPTENTTFVFSNPPASGTAYGFTLKVTGADTATSYDLANASYDSVSFSVSAQESSPYAVVFSPDGTKMYTIGYGSVRVYQYTLSTAWDLSTASYANISFSTSAQTGASTLGVGFKPDGTKMYVVSNTNDRVYQYTLSTAWNVSTASYDNISFVVNENPTPVSVRFKPDGLKMYILGYSSGGYIYQYTLSTAWDISSASYDSVNVSISAQDTQPYGFDFKPDGNELYVVGDTNDSVYQYTLSTAWDLSTASYADISFSTSAQTSSPFGISIKPDGTKMYVMALNSDTVLQYSMSSTAAVTLTYPTSVDWPAATAPDAPADGETDILVFYTEDGGTTYYGFQAGDAMA